MDSLSTLASWIGESSSIVFFGGAGTSTESGIPDFRSAAGLYLTEKSSPYPPEQMLSHSFFISKPEVFFDFYRSKMLHPDAEPNGAHKLLARLEHEGRLSAIVTQNIDGLHQKAGSTRVLELHGSVHRNHCMKCSRPYGLEAILESAETVPHCPVCGGVIKPDVVLYEEELDRRVLTDSIQALSSADLLIIGGTSLTVQPAASLTAYFRGRHAVMLNAEPTAYDSRADLIITDRIGHVFERAGELLA